MISKGLYSRLRALIDSAIRQGWPLERLRVRAEIALSDDAVSRADEISRWIIAEGSPLSLPDGRWDKMSYGVRETEEFLRAIS